MSEPIIVQWLDGSERRPRRPSAADLIGLKEAGASDELLARLLELAAEPEPPVAASPPSAPTAPPPAPAAQAPAPVVAPSPAPAVAPSRPVVAPAPAAEVPPAGAVDEVPVYFELS